MRKVEAVHLRLGARASHYQTSFYIPGRTCQEIATLVATSRYAGVEASLKRQRATGLPPTIVGYSCDRSQPYRPRWRKRFLQERQWAGTEGPLLELLFLLPWQSRAGSPPGPLVVTTTDKLLNSSPSHSSPASDAGEPAGVDIIMETVATRNAQGYTQLSPTFEGTGTVPGSQGSGGLGPVATHQAPCHPCSPHHKPFLAERVEVLKWLGRSAAVARLFPAIMSHILRYGPLAVHAVLSVACPWCPPRNVGDRPDCCCSEWPTRLDVDVDLGCARGAGRPSPSLLTDNLSPTNNKDLSGQCRQPVPISLGTKHKCAYWHKQRPGFRQGLNAALAVVHPSRSSDTIKALRRQPRYRAILAEMSAQMVSPTEPAGLSERPVVLLEELVASTGTLGKVTLKDIHDTYDDNFGAASPTVGEVGVRPGSLHKHCSHFTVEEVHRALKAMAPRSAPGPDGLTIKELRRVPPDMLALIMNNFLTHHHLPEDLRESRTVFLPKCPDAAATDLRPITISSSSLTVLPTASSLDKATRGEVKRALYLPASFPDFMVHYRHRAGGLDVLELSRVSAEVQVKSFARLQHLGSPIVDAVLQGALVASGVNSRRRWGFRLDVPQRGPP
ncbi:hypothetical protein HPB52_013041 [Rhipicephalus sanguineus]|uniref:Uncharacterized protein n=1 Tax=Rhipicephalus sanguineus TaxID=34632 RepID=A0A9D4SMU0_RHISA|nr:hypothetical protein HPB52_013041 [Rhipicephalus sanguineus]